MTPPAAPPGAQQESAAGGPLGISIASHGGGTPSRVGEVAAMAEQAGFEAVFVAEGHGDALALCHPVVAETRRVRVGTAIANAALRPPVLTAKTAAQLDLASGGRLVLGLGVGNAVMNRRFGLAPFRPLAMIEEYVGVIRAVLDGSADGYAGEIFRTGMVPLDAQPVRTGLPIYLAALGPGMLALAGRIADGVILNLMTPVQAADAVDQIRGAADESGRDPTSVEIVCVVHCCLAEDAAIAANAAREVVPRYVLHPVADRLFVGSGGVDLATARKLTLEGDRHRAASCLPQAVADGFVAHGDAAACRVRFEQYRSAGVDLPVIYPMPVEGVWPYEQVITGFARPGSAARQGLATS